MSLSYKLLGSYFGYFKYFFLTLINSAHFFNPTLSLLRSFYFHYSTPLKFLFLKKNIISEESNNWRFSPAHSSAVPELNISRSLAHLITARNT